MATIDKNNYKNYIIGVTTATKSTIKQSTAHAPLLETVCLVADNIISKNFTNDTTASIESLNLTGNIKKPNNSGLASTWVAAPKYGNALINFDNTTFGAIFNANTKTYKVALATFPNSDEYVYLYSVTKSKVNAGTPNSRDNYLAWNAADGTIVLDGISKETAIRKSTTTDGALRITAGTDTNPFTGAQLTLFGKSYTAKNNPGGFRLWAAQSSSVYRMLEGKTDGSLSWNGRLELSFNTYTIHKQNNTGYLQLAGGMTNANASGSTLTLYGSENNSGGWELKAANSTSNSTLSGSATGVLNWNGHINLLQDKSYAGGSSNPVLGVRYKNTSGSKTHTVQIINVIGIDSTTGYNTPVSIGSNDGATHIGAGDSRLKFLGTRGLYDNENLYLTADGSVNIYTDIANDNSTFAGPVTFNGTASATGGSVNVTGLGNITATGTTKTNILNVTNNASVAGALTVTGTSTLSVVNSGAITASGNVTVGSTATNRNLTVNGNITVSGTNSTVPTPATSDNSKKIANTEWVNQRLVSYIFYKGVINANSDLPKSHEVGWAYFVGTRGTYAGKTCEVGDMIICNTTGTTANNAHWDVVQANTDFASTTNLGLVKIGTNINVDNSGLISVNTASTSNKGVVQIGSGLNVSTAGELTHPTTAGNKHIPSGGSSGQILRWSTNGTATWANETALSITDTGTGNAVTGIGVSNHAITLTRTSFLPLTGGTLSGNLTVGSTATNRNLTVNGNSTVSGTVIGDTFRISSTTTNIPASSTSSNYSEDKYLSGKGTWQPLPTITVSTTGTGNTITALSVSNHSITVTKGTTFSIDGHTHVSADITDKMSKSAKGDSGWGDTSNKNKVVDVSYISYWDGSYSTAGNSNLTYCSKGAFGTIVTKNVGDYSTTGHTHTTLDVGTIGSASKPVYFNNGTPTALSATVGGVTKPVYLNAGTITALSATVGSTDTPVYLNGGSITTTGKKFSDYLPLAGGTLSGNLIVGSTATNSNRNLTVYGTSTANAFKLSNGTIIPATSTANQSKFLMGDGTWQALPVASTAQKGIVQIGTNVNVSSGTISVNTSTNKNLGLVKIKENGGILINDGEISLDYNKIASNINGGGGTTADKAINKALTLASLGLPINIPTDTSYKWYVDKNKASASDNPSYARLLKINKNTFSFEKLPTNAFDKVVKGGTNYTVKYNKYGDAYFTNNSLNYIITSETENIYKLSATGQSTITTTVSLGRIYANDVDITKYVNNVTITISDIEYTISKYSEIIKHYIKQGNRYVGEFDITDTMIENESYNFTISDAKNAAANGTYTIIFSEASDAYKGAYGYGRDPDYPFATISGCVSFVRNNYSLSNVNSYINVALYDNECYSGFTTSNYESSGGRIIFCAYDPDNAGNINITSKLTKKVNVYSSGYSPTTVNISNSDYNFHNFHFIAKSYAHGSSDITTSITNIFNASACDVHLYNCNYTWIDNTGRTKDGYLPYGCKAYYNGTSDCVIKNNTFDVTTGTGNNATTITYDIIEDNNKFTIKNSSTSTNVATLQKSNCSIYGNNIRYSNNNNINAATVYIDIPVDVAGAASTRLIHSANSATLGLYGESNYCVINESCTKEKAGNQICSSTNESTNNITNVLDYYSSISSIKDANNESIYNNSTIKSNPAANWQPRGALLYSEIGGYISLEKSSSPKVTFYGQANTLFTMTRQSLIGGHGAGSPTYIFEYFRVARVMAINTGSGFQLGAVTTQNNLKGIEPSLNLSSFVDNNGTYIPHNSREADTLNTGGWSSGYDIS